MKILLDECVPWPMHKLLSGHECTTAQRRGWGTVKNGSLLKLAEREFEIFITASQDQLSAEPVRKQHRGH